MAREIARLRDNSADWTLPGEHWSLAGQQGEFALARQVRDDGSFGWAEAFGSAPTTHIVKPGIGRLHHQALVEHATMRAAGALGVSVAETEYVEFAGQPAIVVNRFDRVQLTSGVVRRIHQEDFAQASGLLYDKATVDKRLALAIGGERRVGRIHEAQWSRAACELGVPEASLRDRGRQLLTDFADAFHDALVKVGTPEAQDVWAQSEQPLAEHTAACLNQLNKPPDPARIAHGPRSAPSGPTRDRTTPASNSGSFRDPKRVESEVELD